MPYKNLPFFALIFAVAMTTSVFGQDRYAVTLNNDFIAKLKQFGGLKSEVPESDRNKIDVIELRFEDTKAQTPIDLEVEVNIVDDAAVIVLDEAMIAKIKGQPVRVSADASNFSRVLLKYDSPALAKGAMITSDDTVFVRLSNVKSIAGELDGLDSITMQTKFGEITVPLKLIAGIRMHTDEDDSAVIVLEDGDSITGVPNVPTLTLITDWGKAEILPDSVKSITTTANSKFVRKNTDFGTRWMLETGNSFAPGM